MVQWLRLHSPNAEGPGSIPGQIPHATTKDPTCCNKDLVQQKKKKKIQLKIIDHPVATLVLSLRSI